MVDQRHEAGVERGNARHQPGEGVVIGIVDADGLVGRVDQGGQPRGFVL